MIAVHLIPIDGDYSAVKIDADRVYVRDDGEIVLYKDNEAVFGMPFKNLLYWQKADGPL